MLKDIGKSFIQGLQDKLVSPLSGFFIISWIVFNWKALSIFVFADDSMYERIEFIASNYSDINCNLLYPLVTAIGASLIYPLVSVLPFYIWQYANNAKKKIIQKLGLEVPASLRETVKLKQALYDNEIETKKLLEEKDSDIQSLVEEIDIGKSIIDSSNNQINELEGKVEELEGRDESSKIKELEEYILHLDLANKNLKDENDKIKNDLRFKSLGYSDDESKWENEYRGSLMKDDTFEHEFSKVFRGIVSGGYYSDSALTYCVAKGLVSKNKGELLLTKKGEYLAKYIA